MLGPDRADSGQDGFRQPGCAGSLVEFLDVVTEGMPAAEARLQGPGLHGTAMLVSHSDTNRPQRGT